MNNILTFSEYKKTVRLYEEMVVKKQILKPLDEGLLSGVRKKINDKASVFVREALADEIEMGKQLNEAIQDAVKELKENIDKIQQAVDDSSPEKTELMKKLEKIFEDIRKSSFELLEILSGVEINFSDYVDNATMATFVNFGMLFIPTRSIFLLKKSYKYFIGLIKNTIRKDMLMLMLNFDQFENTVLVQSLEDDEQTQWFDEMKTRISAYEELGSKLLSSTIGKKKGADEKEAKKIKDAIEALRKGVEARMKLKDRSASSIGFDAKYDNTYTKTLDQLKNFVLEDDSKYLEAIKNGMRALALDEVDTKTFVELLISAAEECAYEVSAAIHTNFIDKVSVFKLANQKQLIDIVKKDKEVFEKEKEEKELERKKLIEEKDIEEKKTFFDKKGSEIFDKVVESHLKKDNEQVDEYNDLGEIEDDETGKKYSEKEILDYYITNNWKESKGKITDTLKLYLNNVPYNKKSYEDYLQVLTISLPGIEYVIYESGKPGTISVTRGASRVLIKDEGDDKIKECGFTLSDKLVFKTYIDDILNIITNKKIIDGHYKKSNKKEKLLRKAIELISENVSEISEKHQKVLVETIIGTCCGDKIEIYTKGDKIEYFGKKVSKEQLEEINKIISSISKDDSKESTKEENEDKK